MTDFLKEAFKRAQVGSNAEVAHKACENIQAGYGSWTLNNCPLCGKALDVHLSNLPAATCLECGLEWTVTVKPHANK